MNKADLAVLERAFCCEIQGRMFQGKSKRITRLVEEGYLEQVTRQDRTPFGILTSNGYALTHAGRITYCAFCPEPQEQQS